MYTLTIPDYNDLWDEGKEEFVSRKGARIKIEHSLVSLAKWEQHYHKPFLVQSGKTFEESVYYIKCMTLTQNVPDSVYLNIGSKEIEEVDAYINDPMTATQFTKTEEKEGASPHHEIMTNELIYYYMIALQIPVEFQKWHLNRLITLIEVCKRKNTPAKKMTAQQLAQHHQSVNARYRAKHRKR